MSTLNLEPIKARLDKAHTEWGPWKAKEDSWDGYSVVIDDNGPGVSIIAEQIGQGEDEGRGDAEMIAHAPSDLAALVAEVERLRGQVNAVKAAVANHPDPCEKHPDGDAVIREFITNNKEGGTHADADTRNPSREADTESLRVCS